MPMLDLINKEKIPNHIAIIMDGNGRWAKAKGMPRSYGHVKGCANLETVCDYMKELGVKYVTVYAFSTENWKRSKDEVDGLMKLFRSYLKKCIKLADKNKMRVRVIGEVSAFDQDIQESIARLEQYSQKYDEIYFQIALNYGSRDEIIRGIRKLAQDAADGKVKPEEIDELGPARSLGNEGQPGMIGQRVDRAGLAGIGAPGEGDLRAVRRGQAAGFGDRDFELGVTEQ